MITKLRSIDHEKGGKNMKFNSNSKIQLQKSKIQKEKEKHDMKNSNYHNYEDLPLFLNAELLAKVLGVGVSSAYELMHEKGFPSVRIGKRFIVPRADLKRWMQEQVAKRGSR